jgi:hypothetical protein
MLIEQFLHGKTIICEICGFDYNPPPNAKDLVSNLIMDSSNSNNEEIIGEEDADTEDNQNPQKVAIDQNQSIQQNQSNYQDFMINEKTTRINEKNILKILTGNWKSIRELARELNVQDAREFYILRMTLNDMNRKGLITMDFQIDRVLIRRKK